MVIEITQHKDPVIRACCVLQRETSVGASVLLVAGFLYPMNMLEKTEALNDSINGHITANDYLPTLATRMLCLMDVKKKEIPPTVRQFLAETAYEMLYTEKYYKLVKRNVPKARDLAIAEAHIWQQWADNGNEA